jgi:SAM-dependent methyltransferase
MSRIRLIQDYVVALLQLINGYRLSEEKKAAEERKSMLLGVLDFSHPLYILDLANGRLQPQYLLLRSEGHNVIGIDLANHKAGAPEYYGYRFARWLYSLRLKRNHLPNPGQQLVCGDVGNLPFFDSHFDMVTSIAAFEHFLDIPRVVDEIYRVLRPGGAAYIRIHPFACPSGAHNIRLMEIPLKNIPKGIDAWDHLRKRRVKITVPLNEWRIADYLECFASRFEILNHYCAMREGEHLLTPEIEAELSALGYTRDELTCGSYVIVARKPEN